MPLASNILPNGSCIGTLSMSIHIGALTLYSIGKVSSITDPFVVVALMWNCRFIDDGQCQIHKVLGICHLGDEF